MNTDAIWLLAPDNFTPPSRTPWGGRRIAERYKKALGVPARDPVGESWELSAGPEFPSSVDPDGCTLGELFARAPDFLLGREAAQGSTSLLVKLLDAAEPLSVQIHPDDGYAGLAPDECGKPESWYVLDAAPGAGIYLGLAAHATRDRMAEALATHADASSLLGFVPVAPGDFFVVEAGTAHAIGGGVTLVEPQIVRPGRKGVTYRYWDWNRRYDREGRPSPDGAPRALHVDHALAVTDWERARGDAFLRAVRTRAGAPDLGAPLRLDALCGSKNAPLASAHLDVSRLAGTGALPLATSDRLRALTVTDGAVDVRASGATVSVARGRTAILAAGARDVSLRADGAHAVLSSVA